MPSQLLPNGNAGALNTSGTESHKRGAAFSNRSSKLVVTILTSSCLPYSRSKLPCSSVGSGSFLRRISATRLYTSTCLSWRRPRNWSSVSPDPLDSLLPDATWLANWLKSGRPAGEPIDTPAPAKND